MLQFGTRKWGALPFSHTRGKEQGKEAARWQAARTPLTALLLLAIALAVEDAMKLMQRGATNRHVGETRLNRESSRSHSVFTCTIERHSKSGDSGLTNIVFSRLNLIDLAGGFMHQTVCAGWVCFRLCLLGGCAWHGWVGSCIQGGFGSACNT